MSDNDKTIQDYIVELNDCHIANASLAKVFCQQEEKMLQLESELAQAKAKDNQPPIICLCGSIRFYDSWQRAIYDFTMNGIIVLSVGFYPHSQTQAHGQEIGCTEAQKVFLAELHKRKIDLADSVYILNVGGYIGESTRSEIAYAIAHGKPVEYLEALAGKGV